MHLNSRAKFRRNALVLALSQILAGTTSSVSAADLLVTNELDAGAGSLREAISTANGTAEADTIRFANSVNQITLTSGELVISDTAGVTITGRISGNNAVPTISGNNSNRVFRVGSEATIVAAKLTLSRLTLVDGLGGTEGGGCIAVRRNSSLTLRESTVSGCSASGGGGILVSGSVETLIEGSTITSNTSTGYPGGGGIFSAGSNITVRNSTISSNTTTSSPSQGGGILISTNEPGRVGVIDRSTVIGNTAVDSGGGIELSHGVTVRNSTVSGNSAFRGGGLSISSDEFTHYLTPAVIQNTTVSGNAATQGGGILNEYSSFYDPFAVGGAIKLSQVTISGNTASGSTHASGLANVRSIVNMANTIIANGTGAAGDCTAHNSAIFNRSGANLVEDGTCGASLSGDPLLSPLADNGGPTPTHLPQFSSPAVNVLASASACDSRTPDQRGILRPQWGSCDLGAVELQGDPPFCKSPGTSIANGSPFGDSIPTMTIGNVADLNLWVQIDHQQVSDLGISLTGPEATLRTLFANSVCANADMNVLFDDSGSAFANSLCAAAGPAVQGEAKPNEPLSVPLDTPIGQIWTLNVVDNFVGADGVVNHWCVLPNLADTEGCNGDDTALQGQHVPTSGSLSCNAGRIGVGSTFVAGTLGISYKESVRFGFPFTVIDGGTLSVSEAGP